MTETRKRASVKAVKVGDQVTIKKGAPGLAALPSGMVVTCRGAYTIQHAGRHTIGGVDYDATDPRKATPQAPAED